MHAAAMRVELRIPGVNSLKEKRSKVKAMMALLTRKFPVAVAEVGFQDEWRRASLGIAIVGAQYGQLERLLHSVERLIRAQPEFEVLEIGVSHLENPL